MARNSAVRLGSDGISVALGIVAGIVTARVLGPADKGVYAGLSYLITVLSQLSALGLGEAAIVLVGKKEVSVQTAVSSTIAPVALTAVVAALLLFVVSLLQFGEGWHILLPALVAGSVAIPAHAYVAVLSAVANSQERIMATSLITTGVTAVTTLAIVVLVGILETGIPGGIYSTLLGGTVGLALITGLVRRMGMTLKPRLNRTYIWRAARYGAVLQISYLLVTLSARVDLLLVLSLAGKSSAGFYSIALTIAQLAGYAAFALSFASFPRLARATDPDQAWELTAQITRVGVATSLLSAVILFAAVPVVVPFVFGHAYQPAVVPTMIMVSGSVLWSVQWILCRAAAARGIGRILFTAYAINLAVMIVLDILVVPRGGIAAAALASVVGSASGLTWALMAYRSRFPDQFLLTDLLPRAHDFQILLQFPPSLLRNLRSRSGERGPH